METILGSLAIMDRPGLLSGMALFLILFLFRRKFLKTVARWTIAAALLAATGMVVHILLNGGAGTVDHNYSGGREKAEPLVKSVYYQDPMERAQTEGQR